MAAKELQEAVASLVGQRCWGAVAGSGTGSVVSLSFGRMIPRVAPLANPHLSAAVRAHEAELSLYVECVWRLESSAEIVAGAWDDNAIGGPMLKGLGQLIDQTVTSAQLKAPGFDLELCFGDERTLRIFCDKTNVDDGDDNYSLFTPTRTFIVGNRSAVRTEARALGSG